MSEGTVIAGPGSVDVGTDKVDFPKRKATITPRRNMVLLRGIVTKETKGGILLPDKATSKMETTQAAVNFEKFEVIAIGPGFQTEVSGLWIDPCTNLDGSANLKVGDRVRLLGFQTEPFKNQDEWQILVSDDLILAVQEGDTD